MSSIQLISINPDSKDLYGHWMSYDWCLHEQARKMGVDFVSLVNKCAGANFEHADYKWRPTFTHNTWWTIGDHLDADSAHRLRQFERECEDALMAVCNSNPVVSKVAFFYTGSLVHALALHELACRYPYINFCVNAFWTSVGDVDGSGRIEYWKDFLDWSVNTKNFAIFAISHKLKGLIRQVSGVDLLVLPHPSISFNDAEFSELRLERGISRKVGKRTTIAIPIGMTDEKGFTRELPKLACILRAQHPDADIVIRATVTDGIVESAEKRWIIERLRQWARIEDGVFTRKNFVDFLGQADVAILPYRRQSWRYRTSGLAVDLMYLGVPLVCYSGTWISDLVGQCGSGVSVRKEGAKHLASATNEILLNLDQYRAASHAAGERYFSTNNWNALVEFIIGSTLVNRSADELQRSAMVPGIVTGGFWDRLYNGSAGVQDSEK